MVLFIISAFILESAAQTQTNIPAPVNSISFGKTVSDLPNGNIVVTDPDYSISGGATGVGAAYLYNGATGALISMGTGSVHNDRIGERGVMIVSNSNYLILSSSWDNGAATNAGAVTWCNGITGCTGNVSAANSLVGTKTDDLFSPLSTVVVLPSGNYVVISTQWDNGALTNVGAITFGNGVTGAVSPVNSLIGSTTEDQIGE